MRTPRSHRILALAAATCLLASIAAAVDDVAGSLITLPDTSTTPNGAWCWFQDERVIIDEHDPNNRLLLVSTISAGSSPENGDVDLHWLNVDTGAQGEFELHDRLQQDDHDSAALWIRPDGRYVACYGKHGNDDFMRWRISTNPHDPTAWSPEQLVDATGSSSDNATYNNVYHLPNEGGGAGRLYDFSRLVNWSPGIVVSYDHGSSWSYAGALLNAGGPRPYARYCGDEERVHFIVTNGHPRDVNNSIYHGYVQDGQLFSSHGALLDSNLFDSSAIPPSGLTTVFAASTVVDGTPMTRCWTVDIEIDSDGNPYVAFQARIDPGSLSGGQDSLDHQYFYARYDDGSSSWNVHSLAPAGRDIYAASPNGSEDDYTGLVALDPNDPDTLYISTEIDPRDDTPLAHYEIFRGLTSDGGVTWAWDPITWNSTMENVRPIVPDWDAENTALLWMRGSYNTYTSWGTEAVALIFENGPSGEITYIDADTGNQSATTNTTYADGSPFTPSTNGSDAPADNTWHERTGYANDGDVLASNAASDSPMIRTTVSGLDAGEAYNVHAYYWVSGDGAPSGNEGWDVAAGLSLGGLTSYQWDDGTEVTDAGRFDDIVLVSEGNRRLFELDLGITTASGAGTIDVFVDDYPGNDDRTWYDGVGTSRYEAGVPYCFGDPGSDTPCPCGNDNDGSVPGSGCGNGVFTSGAQLTGSGVASLGADTLVLATAGLEPNNSGLYFQANNDLSPGNLWGDGLQCAGGQLKRLGVRFSDGSGNSDTSGFALPISVKAGNVQAGDTKYYQCWYRNPQYSPCLSDFNASNGYAVTWAP